MHSKSPKAKGNNRGQSFAFGAAGGSESEATKRLASIRRRQVDFCSIVNKFENKLARIARVRVKIVGGFQAIALASQYSSQRPLIW